MSEHPVVACYGGLASARAVQLGALLSAATHAPLVIASAYRYEPVGLSARAVPAPGNERRAAAAHAALRNARALVGPDVEVREEVVAAAGIPEALIALATDLEADMLVVGRDADGHVTRALVPRAPCPVAVAPLSVALPADGRVRCIGVAYDGSPTAQNALLVATGLARSMDARLVLLSAGPTTEHSSTWLQIARLSVGHRIEVESRALAGDAAQALTQASGDVDLLVCGSRGRGRPLATLLGSVSAHLAAHAGCPVLVAPPSPGGLRRLRAA